MGKQTDIVTKASDFVFQLFKEQLPEYIVFHTYSHTETVVDTARKIGKATSLDDDAMEIAMLACLFHATGYTKNYGNAEAESIGIVTGFLKQVEYPEKNTASIAGCIRAMNSSDHPKGLLEEIVCDANLSYLGKKSFFEKSALLRVELEKASGEIHSDQEWDQKDFDLLTGYKYFTRYAENEFGKQHAENIRSLYKKLRRTLTPKEEAAVAKSEIERQKLARSAEKDALPERGTETMFKILARSLMTDSSMADHKAQTMIRSNAVIITGVVGLAFRNLENLPQSIAIPMFMLLGVSILTIFFAVFATRPKISSGITTHQEIKDKTSNLLFFGNFFKMSYADYDWGIKEMMNDKDYLYGSIIRDSYFHAKSVGRKYRYLNLSYSIFMYGLCIVALAFLIFYITDDSLSQMAKQHFKNM